MTENMMERIGKAIYEGRNGNGCTAWGRLPQSHKAPYLSDARAAIEAMREPTPEMLAATLPITGQHRDPAAERLAERALLILEPPSIELPDHMLGKDAALTLITDWRSMINEALK